MAEITGREAISLAAERGLTLRAHADPTGAPGRDVTADEAREICEEDPSLVYAVVGTETIETEEHRRAYAAEQLSRELADRGEDMPEAGPERRVAVEAWLGEHPEVLVGARVSAS